MPDRCGFICVTSSGRPSCRRREPPDRRAFVPKRGILFRKENTPFCCYRPQHCLFSALPCSAKNAGWQLARRWRGNRSYAAYQQAASVTVRSTAYFPRCRAAQKMPDGSSLAAGTATARMPRISRLRPLPSAALLIFRAAVQRKKCRMAARSPLARQPLVCRVSAGCVRYRPQHCLFSALPRSAKNAGWQLARRWRGNRSYAAYQQAASVTVRSTAYTFFRCRRGRGRCGRSSAPCAAAFSRCRRPRWWRRCPRPRARA